MKQSPIVIHPYLFAIFPALSIVADHVRFLSINRKILGMALITIMVAFLSNYLLTRAGIERRKAGIFVSLFLLLFFSYGHVYTLISDTFRGIDIRHRHLLFFWIILAIILVFLSTKASNILAPYEFPEYHGSLLGNSVSYSNRQLRNFDPKCVETRKRFREHR